MEKKEKSKVTALPTAAAKQEAPKMISVVEADAQMQKVYQQARAQIQQVAARCNELEAMLRDKTVENLFSVLKYSVHFDEHFVAKTASTIEEYITKIAFAQEEPAQESEKKEAEQAPEKAE